MKQGKSLEELARELDRQNREKQDFVADSREVTMLGGTELSLKGHGEFELTDIAHGQVAARLKIPKPYYERMRDTHPELLDRNVNTWLRDAPERRMVRTLDGKARAYLSDRYRRLDNFDLAQVVLPVLGETEGVRIDSTELTDARMYLKAVFPNIQEEVRGVGDIVQAAVVISNSEVGQGSLKVEPMVFTLACSNGMIAADRAMRKYHLGGRIEESDAVQALFTDETLRADDTAFFLKVKDLVRAAASDVQFRQIVDGLRDLAGIKIEGNPIQAVEQLADTFSLAESERDGVLSYLIQGGDLTGYGALNAVTRFAQDVESYDRSVELERVGGEIAAMPQRELVKVLAN